MFRVTMNGNFEDFETLEEALDYIKKKWKKNTFNCNIRLFFIQNVISEMGENESKRNIS